MDIIGLSKMYANVKNAMRVLDFPVLDRGIPSVVIELDNQENSYYNLNEHLIVLTTKCTSILVHELTHSLQTYEVLSHNIDKEWYTRDAEIQAMTIENVFAIGIENTEKIIDIIGNQWNSNQMWSWFNFFNYVIMNKINCEKASKPYRLSTNTRKKLNQFINDINF